MLIMTLAWGIHFPTTDYDGANNMPCSAAIALHWLKRKFI